jgi:hypothetical protein
MSVDGLVEFELWSKGDWPQRDIVGESFHEAAIRSFFPKRIGEGDRELFIMASLIPEPTNPYDKHAVKVVVGGQHAGYLSKEDAPNYQPVIARLIQQGLLPVTKCRIYGSEYEEWVGTDRRGRDIMKLSFASSIRLTLDEPHLCVPVNLPPSYAHAMLPFGSAIQVRKEENHQDVLRKYVTREGECWVHGTLHAILDGTSKAVKELVEIRIDNQRVGELTPAMSGAYLPIIQQLFECGRATAAKLIVKGNQVHAEVVLHAAKAHELDASWLASHLSSGAGADDVRTSSGGRSSVVFEHAPIPPKPTRIRFRVPPGWPPAPDGWEPGPGWRPDPGWPPAASDWLYWRAED